MEAAPVNPNQSRRGRGRGKGKGGGKFSKLPSPTDVASKILEAEKYVISDANQESTLESVPEELSTPVTPATRSVNNLRREHTAQQQQQQKMNSIN